VYGQRPGRTGSLCGQRRLSCSVRHKDSRHCVDPAWSRIGVQVQHPRFELFQFNDEIAFTGTDRGLLRSVLGPWSPVPKCDARTAPISVEEHTSMAPRPRRQSQNPPLQKSSAIPALPWPSKPRLRYSPGLAPTTRLNALLNAASDS
jgi:hypothetical protein